MDQRKCRFILLLFVYEMCLLVHTAVSDTESGIVERVSRQQERDIYYFINSSTTGTTCGSENTYLISENQCVKDQELFTGCSDAVVPNQLLYPTVLAVLDRPMQNNITHLSTKVANGTAIFKFNETNQMLNSSSCHISSLEVYQGREQAIEISSEGFFLNNNSNIVISIEQLGYDLEEYVGELYRMNLSCSGGGLPESGCLFFKVRGQGYVTNAKFNCTVPGTLCEECDYNIFTSTVVIPTETTTDSIVPTSYITTSKVDDEPLDTDLNDGTDFGAVYSLAGLGGGSLFLTFCIIAMCTCVCLRLARGKRKLLTFTADNVYTMEDDEQPQQQNDDERVHIQENDLRTTSRTVSSDSVIVSEDTEHVYAVLEQTQLQQSANSALLNNTTLIEQDQQTHLTETIPSNGFQHVTNQTGLKSRSATWSSAQQSTVGSKPRHENLELVQVYDNVMIETEGRTVTDIDNGPSCPGNYRKHSLPADLGGHRCSSVSQDYPVSNESDKKTDESIPIYSKPDMNKKREEHRKKREQKEQDESMIALQKASSSSSPPLPQLTENSTQQKNEPLIERALGTVVDGQQQSDTDLKFEKQFGEQNNNSEDKALMGKEECLYDTPTNLDLVPKKNKNITQRKEKGKDGEEEL